MHRDDISSLSERTDLGGEDINMSVMEEIAVFVLTSTRLSFVLMYEYNMISEQGLWCHPELYVLFNDLFVTKWPWQ